MKTKHTPGPWVLDESHLSGSINRLEGDARHIALVSLYQSKPGDREENEANAKLIAAAPDLLVDLIEAAKTLRLYEALHRAKGTDESTAKAEVNAEFASRFESTIARATA